jgi:HD superfamily phosphodiesterase
VRGSKHGIDREDYRVNARFYHPRGSQLPHAKLNEKQVQALRRLDLRRQRLIARINARYGREALAAQHGISLRALENILNYSTWKHVPD